ESGCGFSIPAQDPVALAEAIEKMASLSDEERLALGAKGRAFVEAHHDYPQLAERFLKACLGL
ncbi:MAG: glycosyltransferase, partial [Bdellovibrio sp.]